MGKGGWSEFSSDPAALRRVAPEQPQTPRAQQRVRVQRTRAGKKGKTVTQVTGLELGDDAAKALLKQIKGAVGSGGSWKDGVIELQGDQVTTVLQTLEQQGFRPKQAGG
ncbi:MAG: translation initiation factor [Synechococcus sp. TMED155]|nr:MAG: translation initiation factor [Synechococcus sp. TMED155]